jgi:hypothetical protein
MERRFPHRLTYVSSRPWPLEDVITNLQAQKRLLEEGIALLDRIIPGLEVTATEIRITRVTTGSPLVTDFLVLLYSEYQEQIEDQVVVQIEKMFGTDIPAEYNGLVTLGTLAATYFVSRWAYEAIRGKSKPAPPSIHIQGNYNTVVNTLSDKLNVSTESIDDAIQKQLPLNKRRQLIASVAKFLRPRSDGLIVPIRVDGAPDIDPETISELPSDTDLQQLDDTSNIDVTGARIEIRAVDRDRTKTGWAARISGDKRFGKRLPMDLYPTVNQDELAKHESVVADIIVMGLRDTNGKFVPKRIHLISFRPDLQVSEPTVRVD